MSKKTIQARSKTGITVGLIDAAIGALNAAAGRNLRPRAVQEAIWDLRYTLEILDREYMASQRSEPELLERVDLIRKPSRSVTEEKRLAELDEFVRNLPPVNSLITEAVGDFRKLMTRIAADFPPASA